MALEGFRGFCKPLYQPRVWIQSAASTVRPKCLVVLVATGRVVGLGAVSGLEFNI